MQKHSKGESFSRRMDRLEKIVERLESEDIELEDAQLEIRILGFDLDSQIRFQVHLDAVAFEIEVEGSVLVAEKHVLIFDQIRHENLLSFERDIQDGGEFGQFGTGDITADQSERREDQNPGERKRVQEARPSRNPLPAAEGSEM